MLTDLMKQVDVFVERYSRDDASRKGLKNDLLEIVQKAIELGEGKDQNKISGIIVKGIKAFMGGKE
jgi:hypothetical protein